jgi:hypothetical protein
LQGVLISYEHVSDQFCGKPDSPHSAVSTVSCFPSIAYHSPQSWEPELSKGKITHNLRRPAANDFRVSASGCMRELLISMVCLRTVRMK